MASTHPIALFFAFILIVVVVKILLGRIGFFKKNPSFVMPIVIAAGIFVLVYLLYLSFRMEYRNHKLKK